MLESIIEAVRYAGSNRLVAPELQEEQVAWLTMQVREIERLRASNAGHERLVARLKAHITDLQNDHFELRQQRADALALHVSAIVDPMLPYECCSTCLDDNGGPVSWPCPTARALGAAEPTTGGESDA